MALFSFFWGLFFSILRDVRLAVHEWGVWIAFYTGCFVVVSCSFDGVTAAELWRSRGRSVRQGGLNLTLMALSCPSGGRFMAFYLERSLSGLPVALVWPFRGRIEADGPVMC